MPQDRVYGQIAAHRDKVLIVDFGSQVTQLIARRVREAAVYCEIAPAQDAERAFAEVNPKAVILSGGPASAHEAGAPRIPESIFAAGVPILGICYGQQVMAAQLGGRVTSMSSREFGRAEVEVLHESALFEGVWEKGKRYPVWMSHGDAVIVAPPGIVPIAASGNAPLAAIADEKRRLFGVQFHLEVTHTPDGAKLIANFLHKIAILRPDWSIGAFRAEAVAAIRAAVDSGRVLCGLSGGVDSAVTAVLIHEAIGGRLTCVFVDHGLLREGEAEEVVRLFRGHYNIPLVHAKAAELFLGALKGVEDPEEKRKTIGRLFVETFEREAKKIAADGGGTPEFLAQGTLYPDVIESASARGEPSASIKSHHNVGGLPSHMNMKLIEPLRELFKDEVRALGRELGLPQAFLSRHPFPGPGLAIRCLGEVTAEKLAILRRADAVYRDEIEKAGLYNEIWQAFAVLLPVRSVGVMGDGRSYEFVCALRAVTSSDGMTADFFPFEMDFLARTATRIINEVKGINRIVYDITSKPPGTIEWE